MTKRTKENFVVAVVLVILGILIVFAAKTAFVGIGLTMCSNAIVEADMKADECSQMRIEADSIYNEINSIRDNFYNSDDGYIRWISNMDNIIRIPFGLLVILSPFLFIKAVRSYRLNMIRKRKIRG